AQHRVEVQHPIVAVDDLVGKLRLFAVHVEARGVPLERREPELAAEAEEVEGVEVEAEAEGGADGYPVRQGEGILIRALAGTALRSLVDAHDRGAHKEADVGVDE